MKKNREKALRIVYSCLIIYALIIGGIFVNYGVSLLIDRSIETPRNTFSVTIHALITMTQNGKLVFQQYHAGAITYLGMNTTLGKITGYATSYNMTQYLENVTYVSIGNGSVSQSLTVLPYEWNRTSGTIHDATYNSFNITGIFAATVGVQTASCIGLNFESGIALDGSLWAYDSFTTVSGIDSGFTITIEFKVTVS